MIDVHRELVARSKKSREAYEAAARFLASEVVSSIEMPYGVIVPGLHLAFLSYAHTPEDVDRVIAAFKQSFLDIREKGLV